MLSRSRCCSSMRLHPAGQEAPRAQHGAQVLHTSFHGWQPVEFAKSLIAPIIQLPLTRVQLFYLHISLNAAECRGGNIFIYYIYYIELYYICTVCYILYILYRAVLYMYSMPLMAAYECNHEDLMSIRDARSVHFDSPRSCLLKEQHRTPRSSSPRKTNAA